jgi:hypothetical protein
MVPSYALTLEPATNGERRATLRLELQHTGCEADDEFYAGFQRWWVDVGVPAGSHDVFADTPPTADPTPPNGGSYAVELPTGESTELTITFTMPVADQLLLRRQPGLTNPRVTVTAPGCQASLTTTLSSDVLLALRASGR